VARKRLASCGRFLYEVEVNEGGAMVERRAQLVGLRGREIALRLQHEEIRGRTTGFFTF
jgi:hypothetical protein